MLSDHAKGLLITASGVLIISPDGLLARLIETDHWTLVFWRAQLLSFGMWLVISLSNPNRVLQQHKTVRGPGLLILGLYVVPIGTALMFIGPRYIPAAEVGLLILLESILGPIWVWLVLAEQPGVNTLAGGAIILSTLAINTVWSLRHPLPKQVA
ncbi:MAG: EamA family transporter [Gammaproteobacteria bacterium]|nr:EamA family transporter [Gammaproteobacteria bacterium]